ncbi:MAG: winged helix-turn-helix domain-containing protein [Dehalococcoidia bacterium]|nr:winged helix-turn-helix domain-containing protein [Dehalococcoidia bacterium]
MSLPQEKDIRIPLLTVIAEAGGELRMRDAIAAVEKHFPELTAEDKLLERASGGLAWPNRIQWVRQYLVSKGFLYREPRGVWRITPEGRVHLESSGKNEPPHPQLPFDGPRLHRELQEKLSQTASLLGYHAAMEYPESPYRYDIVWKEFPGAARPVAVFEVQDKGNLIEALAKLQHARDAWGSRLFLVITGEKDQKKAQQLTGTYLSGTFHRLAPFLTVLTPAQVESLFSDLERHADLLRRLMQE